MATKPASSQQASSEQANSQQASSELAAVRLCDICGQPIVGNRRRVRHVGACDQAYHRRVCREYQQRQREAKQAQANAPAKQGQKHCSASQAYTGKSLIPNIIPNILCPALKTGMALRQAQKMGRFWIVMTGRSPRGVSLAVQLPRIDGPTGFWVSVEADEETLVARVTLAPNGKWAVRPTPLLAQIAHLRLWTPSPNKPEAEDAETDNE